MEQRRVVIAGGGAAGLEALVGLRELAADRARLTLVAPEEAFAWRPLGVGEPFGLGRPQPHPLAELAAELGAEHRRAAVRAVEAGEHRVRLDEGSTLAYDLLLLALGARMSPAFPHAVTFDRAADPDSFDRVVAELEAGELDSVAYVIPPGADWTLPAYELALMSAAWGARARPDGVRVVLVTPEPRPLAVFGPRAADEVAAALAEGGVEWVSAPAPRVPAPGAILAGTRRLEARRVVALPVPVPVPLEGVPTTEDGWVPADALGRVPGLPGVFAAGDGTALPLKQGGLATQQADAVAATIAAELGAPVSPGPLHPVLRGLLRTSRGPLYLRAELGEGAPLGVASREPLWWPASKVASRHLTPFIAAREQERARGGGVPSVAPG